MATWRVNNSTSLGGEVCAPWVANHAYSLGARVVCRVAYATTAARAFVYECTSAGTSHATTEPSWPTTVGNTVVDNGATWTCRSPSDGSWDNASCILPYVLNHASADGDTIYVDDGHNETLALSSPVYFNGSVTAGVFKRVYCVDKATDALSTGAVIYGRNKHMYFLYFLYSYGITYDLDAAGNYYNLGIASGTSYQSHIILEGNNTTVLKSSGAYGTIQSSFGGSSVTPSILEIRNGKIDIDDKDVTIKVGGCGQFRWRGGKFDGTEGSVALFTLNDANVIVNVQDVDLEDVGNGANSCYLVESLEKTDAANFLFTRCKLPSDAGFGLVTSFDNFTNGTVRLHHCSSANQTYDFYETSYLGVVEDSTSIYRTGGASDGTTALSAKMVSSAGCAENIIALESPPIHGWTSSTTEKTFTVEGVWDSATNIQNDEIWVELEYPADNSSGLGAIAKDKCAILGTPADQTASTATWEGTGAWSHENKFKLSVTVTPGKAGPICARVYLAKASTTVYVDPMITES